jgi:pyruvate dehydrogenase E1 component alpha subunit
MRCPTHLSIGQEARRGRRLRAPVGRRRDDLTHRSHAHYLPRAGDLKAMFAELYGKAPAVPAARAGRCT